MKRYNPDSSTELQNGKRSKAHQNTLFEKKLRDIYSDEKEFMKPNSKMLKKTRFKNLENSPPNNIDEFESNVTKMERVFEYANKRSLG